MRNIECKMFQGGKHVFNLLITGMSWKTGVGYSKREIIAGLADRLGQVV